MLFKKLLKVLKGRKWKTGASFPAAFLPAVLNFFCIFRTIFLACTNITVFLLFQMQNFSHFNISEITMWLTIDVYVKFNGFFPEWLVLSEHHLKIKEYKIIYKRIKNISTYIFIIYQIKKI